MTKEERKRQPSYRQYGVLGQKRGRKGRKTYFYPVVA
jgi:hypothetical protein